MNFFINSLSCNSHFQIYYFSQKANQFIPFYPFFSIFIEFSYFMHLFSQSIHCFINHEFLSNFSKVNQNFAFYHNFLNSIFISIFMEFILYFIAISGI
jgi:hypothetical protein